MNKIRVLIVDDHHLVREGFSALLKTASSRFEVIGEAEHGEILLDFLRDDSRELPDIVLLDINMPILNGIQTAEIISNEFPGVKILALSIVKQVTHIKHMLKKGAMGYLLKDCNQEELFEALETVYKGGNYYSPSISKIILEMYAKSNKNKITPANALTKRELEVLHLIVQDFSNAEIANKLFISHRTVDAHKHNILHKTGVKSVAGLVVFAIKHNLVDVPA
jgi:DNA-binding NarL/FixJ family response regulator